MNRKKVEEIFKKEWYIQGLNATPIFLSSAGLSGFQLKKDLGFEYSSFIFNYRNDYGEIRYLKDDLKRIWNLVKTEMEKDENYLNEIHRSYFDKFSSYDDFFSSLEEKNLMNMGEADLVSTLRKSVQAMTDSVGSAHIIEVVGMEIEAEFKEKLFESLEDKTKFNYYISALTNPSELSFLAEEENDLLKIKNLSSQKEIDLKKHAEKYFWINNSYAGPKNLDAEFFLNKMNSLPNEAHVVKKDRDKLIEELSLSDEIKKIIETIDFTTVWQDRRKINILKAISYLGAVIFELGRRTEVGPEILYYLDPSDIEGVKSLREIKNLEKDLINRRGGAFFVYENGRREYLITGEEYETIIQEERLDEKKSDRELRGSIANMGTAIGRAVICTSIESIGSVRSGDILVASMTRPEFMPALKKAAAIVTDEGGITCHAAIVARELGIPAIIGTKIATKVLKNGMLVEVKANHGLVKIIQ